MSGSSVEREMRDAVAAHLRATICGARVIHELVVGGCRADLAAVEPRRITLVEIKSAKDTLSRLKRQARAFGDAAHDLVVVADERWFDTTPYNNGAERFAASDELWEGCKPDAEIWCWPRAEAPSLRASYSRWTIPSWRRARAEPHAARMLEMLHKAELLEEAARHRVSAGSRTTCTTLVRDMVWMMTGREITEAVCRQLRLREFPEADEPIGDAVCPTPGAEAALAAAPGGEA